MKPGVEQGSSSSSRNDDPLLTAVLNENISDIQKCLQSGMKPTYQHLNAIPPLNYDCDDLTILTLLINAGGKINPNHCDRFSHYFNIAIEFQRTNVLEALVLAGFKPTYHHLKMALIKGCYKIADFLVSNDVKIDNRDLYFLQNRLIQKMKESHLEPVQILIKAGVPHPPPASHVSYHVSYNDLSNNNIYDHIFSTIRKIVDYADLDKKAILLHSFVKNVTEQLNILKEPLHNHFWHIMRKSVNEGNLNIMQLFKDAQILEFIRISPLEKQALVFGAIKNKDVMMLKILLSMITDNDSWISAPLLYECLDNPFMLSLLVNNGATVLTYDIEPIENAFFQALKNNDDFMLRELMDAGADYLYTRRFKQDPLVYAKQYCNKSTQALLNNFGFKEHRELMPVNHNGLALFYQGIDQARTAGIGAALAKCLSLDDKRTILTRFLPPIDHDLTRHQKRISRNKEYISILLNIMRLDQRLDFNTCFIQPLEFETFEDIKLFLHHLQPEEGFTLPRKKSGLARSATVIRSAINEYSLFIETKSKLVDHHPLVNPNKAENIEKVGENKKGKPNWRVVATVNDQIDIQEVQYFHLVCDGGILHNNHPVNNRNEAHLSQALYNMAAAHKDSFNRLFIGPLRKKGLSLLSIKAECDLEMGSKKIKMLPQHEQIDFYLELTTLFHFMHENQYIFGDLHEGNILLYSTANGKLHPRLTDFSNTEQYKSTVNIQEHPDYKQEIIELCCILDDNLGTTLNPPLDDKDSKYTKNTHQIISFLNQYKNTTAIAQPNESRKRQADDEIDDEDNNNNATHDDGKHPEKIARLQ